MFTLIGCSDDEPADSLQGLTSTFPCVASNLGLVGGGDCGTPDLVTLSVMNSCTNSLELPANNGGAPVVVAPSGPDSVHDWRRERLFVLDSDHGGHPNRDHLVSVRVARCSDARYRLETASVTSVRRRSASWFWNLTRASISFS